MVGTNGPEVVDRLWGPLDIETEQNKARLTGTLNGPDHQLILCMTIRLI